MKSFEEICRKTGIPKEEVEETLFNMLCDIKNYGLCRKTEYEQEAQDALFAYLLSSNLIAYNEFNKFHLTPKGERFLKRGYIEIDLQAIEQEKQLGETQERGKLFGGFASFLIRLLPFLQKFI